MAKVVKVEAIVAFYIQVPDECDDKQEVYNFMANNVSYTDAFEGISDPDQTMRITEVNCVEEDIVDMDFADI